MSVSAIKKRIIIVCPLFIFLFILTIFIPIPAHYLEPAPNLSLRILDRNSELLREVLSDEQGQAHWVQLEEVSPFLINATIAIEDGRFYDHWGVDPLAIGRALIQNLRSGKFVSGGSTISQQLTRMIYHLPRTIPCKIMEAWITLRLERTYSKKEILTQYLNRAPYGNQTFGIEAAARLYFAKPAAHLSLAEAAFLAGLPKSPTDYNPYRHLQKAKRRQKLVLNQMWKKGKISQSQFRRALEEPLNLLPKEVNFKAPHFCDFVLSEYFLKQCQNIAVIWTSLDLELNQAVELLLRGHILSLEQEGVTNGAVLVLDNDTGEVMAMAGSVDYFDPEHSGQVNGVLALRQPGSTLKPFTYGLALERGYTAASLLPDIETHAVTAGGDFTPKNYDGIYHGPVRLRTALACSYNVPAVRVLENLGTDLLLHRLQLAEFSSLNQPPIHYGLGLTLGNGEVTLLELVRAYSALARGGLFLPEKPILKVQTSHPPNQALNKANMEATPALNQNKISDSKHFIFSPQVSYLLTDILKDNDARVPAFGSTSVLNLPFPCAVKTGTSKDFRDNWCLGYTPKFTIGVWVGNFDGKPMHRVSGITGAGPLFRDVMLLLEEQMSTQTFQKPDGFVSKIICSRSGRLPNPHCPGIIKEIFIPGTEPKSVCEMHQMMPVDRRSQRLASTLTPAEFIKNKLVEILPPLYRPWADQEGSTLFTDEVPDLLNNRTDSYQLVEGVASNELTITFPDDGDIFKVDPILRAEFQTLKLEAVVLDDIHDVSWWIDNEKFRQVKSPYTTRWPLQQGVHRFQIAGKRGENRLTSRIVKILVL